MRLVNDSLHRKVWLTATLALLLFAKLHAKELYIAPRYIQESIAYEDSITGEVVYEVLLTPLTVFPELKFKNKKEEEFYWRTVRDVKKTLPYAKLISRTLTETYEYIETLPSKKEREKHLEEMESEVFKQYKPELKKFSRGQAKLLVKLIQRQTDQTGYEIIKAFLGSFRAGFWQAFGRLFGVSLKTTYRPHDVREDALIERICIEVEQGTL